jgi:hypothetical protein
MRDASGPATGSFTGPHAKSKFLTAGSVRAFRNAGETTLKQLRQTSPSGFEFLFSRIAEEVHRDGGPDMARVVEISTERGIHYA